MEMHANFRFATNMARACSHGCCALSLPSAHNRTGKLSMKGSRKTQARSSFVTISRSSSWKQAAAAQKSWGFRQNSTPPVAAYSKR
jgi:hypothetical protein